MADPREDILDRLVTLLQGLTEFATVARNAGSLDDLELPAVVVNDGDESADDGELGTGKPAYSPQRVTMTPELIIKADGKPEDVGATLNALRAAVIKAVMSDATLAATASNGGKVRYLGGSTALAYGRSMTGEMGLSFGITYVLRPNAL